MPTRNATAAPASRIPFAANLAESFDLMRKFWGAAGMPGAAGVAQFAQGLPQALPSMITPTFDVAELDKRIADLRAVEQWLNLNTNMLRATIQTLEVQRNTIATLKSFGSAMLTPAAPKPQQTPTPSPPPATDTAQEPQAKRKGEMQTPPDLSMPFNPAAWWSNLQDQFARIAASAAPPTDKPAGKTTTLTAKKTARKRTAKSLRPASRPDSTS